MNSGVWIGPEVDPRRIAPDAVIHPGCRISGAGTSIGPGCEIGAEAPVTLQNCRLGRSVKLKGGFFEGAVFLDGSNMGSGAHVREGTILEEEANGAHTVGLKQTVLLPFVTLGSLINFCDILMAGGTSRKDHSEVGSSYIHFNFTPNQDKATASLVGDVPRGVLLQERPVFLGGQGGLVGPSRIAFGCVVAAGGICRRDLLEGNQLYVPPAPPEKNVPFEPGRYGRVDRITGNCLAYIGNIRALSLWYRTVRVHFIRDEFDRAVYQGALENLDLILKERSKRLGEMLGKAGGDPAARWPQIRSGLESFAAPPAPEGLVSAVQVADKASYISWIKALSPEIRRSATAWLQSVVDLTAAL